MSGSKKIAWVNQECVACGSCIKYCPRLALTIHKGLYAAVDVDKCMGCGKCAAVCPAGVIDVVLREAEAI